MELQNALYLIPVGLSEAPINRVLPETNIAIVRGIRHFIVENIRSARRFLKKADKNINIDSLTFCELNRHTDPSVVSSFLDPLRQGEPIGVLSDAGCPAVADPGALPVAIAQREGLKVVPLVGPSSVLLALMASGFSGQGFSFRGYLPAEAAERASRLKKLESESRREGMTQIFIETPYRNTHMLQTMVQTLAPQTMVCVAASLTDPDEEKIVSMPVAKWVNVINKGQAPVLDKRPAIFLMYAGGDAELQLAKKHKH